MVYMGAPVILFYFFNPLHSAVDLVGSKMFVE